MSMLGGTAHPAVTPDSCRMLKGGDALLWRNQRIEIAWHQQISIGTPYSYQAPCRPARAESAPVCLGIPLAPLYASRTWVSSLGLTGTEVMPYEGLKTAK